MGRIWGQQDSRLWADLGAGVTRGGVGGGSRDRGKDRPEWLFSLKLGQAERTFAEKEVSQEHPGTSLPAPHSCTRSLGHWTLLHGWEE